MYLEDWLVLNGSSSRISPPPLIYKWPPQPNNVKGKTMSISRPCTVKVKTGVYINMSTICSFSIDLGLAQKIPVLKEGGNPENPKDWEDKLITADTVSFYFPGDRGLSYRVGHDIERSDFERIKRTLTTLEYKERPNERKPSADEAPQKPE